MAGSNGNNGRVTVAKLGEKIDNLAVLMQEVREGQREQAREIGALQTADVALSGRIDRTNDRISVWAAGQAALTALASGLVGWLGLRH